jgi:hypothetical protein
MTCGYSKETLALYIEDDLPSAEAVSQAKSHVASCAECRHYCDQLRRNQWFIKSRFGSLQPEPVSQDVLTGIRYTVMSQIEPVRQSLGWAIRFERFLMLGMRKPRYAGIAFAVVAVVSASLLAQIRYSAPMLNRSAAVFGAKNTLFCPTDYREWVFAGSCAGHQSYDGSEAGDSSPMHYNVYIDPKAYSDYKRSGKFPEGTIMVLEKDQQGLEVSVKDSNRFAGGWGFFDFTDTTGKLKAEAEVLPQTAGCLSCHRDNAETDHVFTQFYPVL